MRYVLYWSDVNGVERSEELPERGEVFIGRADLNMRLKLGAHPLQVYIYYPDQGLLKETGIQDLTVSRLHVKLVIKDGMVYIVDHGPKGRGSTNGTYVNERRVESGKLIELKPGDRIRLGSYDTTFMLVARERAGEKPTVTLESGVPQVIPVSIARELQRRGIAEEVVKLSDTTAIIVISGSKRATLDNIRIQASPVSEERRVKGLLENMRAALYEAEIKLRDGRAEEAVIELRKIQLKPYRELLDRLGDEELIRVYEEVRQYVKLEAYGEELRDKVRALRCLVEEYMRIHS